MPLLQDVRDDASKDRGVRRVFCRDQKTGEECAFGVRRIPQDVRRRVVKRHKADRKQPGNGSNLRGLALCQRDLAVYALTYSEKAEIAVADQGAADRYSRLLSKEFKVGDVVLLDPGFEREDVRMQALEDLPTVSEWAIEQANKLDAQAEEDEGKDDDD